ncbi:MAG: DUF998 domain-containing protein [Cyclobacteriaceae bacterium]|nr:DUF998 domain-containing protein [Cyclobacteriaceae bacterium]
MARELIVTKNITARQFLFSRIALVSGISYIALFLLLHVLKPEFDPTWRFISEYALGKFGILMNITFFLIAASLICSAYAIFNQIKTVVGYIGLAILIISGLAYAVAAMFNTDPITTELSNISFTGKIHYTAAAFDYTPVAMLLLAFGLGRNKAWRPIRTNLFIVAAISIFLTILFMASMPSDYKFQPGVYTGFVARFLIISYLIWIVVICSHARKLFNSIAS